MKKPPSDPIKAAKFVLDRITTNESLTPEGRKESARVSDAKAKAGAKGSEY